MKFMAACLALLLVPLAALAELPPETRWADPSHVVLDVEFPGDGYHANWELFRCDCGDLLVHSELNVPGEAEVGETLMVHRRAVLSRGFGDMQEEMGASLDAPALMMQLALRLLERAEPGGPSKVTSDLGVDLRLNTPVDDIDRSTLRFGKKGTEDSLQRCKNKRSRDYNGDGIDDLYCVFYFKKTDLAAGDTKAKLTGETKDGGAFKGSDAIEVVGCRGCRR